LRRINCWSSGNGPAVFSGISEHVPRSVKSAAVNVVRGAGAVVDGRPEGGLVVSLVIGSDPRPPDLSLLHAASATPSADNPPS
jgi:hypothetical protein